MPVANLILWAVWWDAELARWSLWAGLVLLTVGLLLLIRTRWGQQPLGKCVVLSVLAHLLLGLYMTTVNIVTSAVDAPPAGDGVPIMIVNDGGDRPTGDALAPQQWNAISGDDSLPLPVPDLTAFPLPALRPVAEPQREALPEIESTLGELPARPPTAEIAPPEMASVAQPLVRPKSARPEATTMAADEPTSDQLVPPPERTVDTTPPEVDPAAQAANEAANSAAGALANPQTAPLAAVPDIYAGRSGNHLGPQANGATRQTEAAVAAALRWLATNQSPNGRWDPLRLDAGRGLSADGEDRRFAGMHAGAHADTGLTGLALLSFLASGHTHLKGPYRDNVRRGLEYLLAAQDATGNLGATNNLYERMYCHAMACCALSEAYAMSRDERLLPGLRRAIEYTVRTQDRSSGSWRYQVGQSGDASLLGWQVMGLKSAELGGLPIPSDTRHGMERFLRSVTSGSHGGLACYQPIRPVATRSMTAEVLACRQFLGATTSSELIHEASQFLMQELPGTSITNHYYWYYATLALHQAGGEPWRRWNEALQKTLLATQRTDGSWAGSWDPDPVWGRSGGRVYSTALCTLSLEVYYRYLPLYVLTAERPH